MPPIPLRSLLLTAALVLAGHAPAAAHDPASVLLVINADHADSARVGDHYASLRGVPEGNVLRVPMPTAEEVSRDVYTRQIEAPIADWLARHAAHDRILFIVLAKGVPLRIAGTSGRQGTVASVDSELSVLYRRLTGRPVPAAGPVPNPYFLGDRAPGEARPFARRDHDIFLVTRLDGFTAQEAMDVATRGHAASERAPAGLVAPGRVVLDQRAAIDDRANDWLKAAAARLDAMGLGDRVLLEATSAVVRDQRDLVGYYSWGSNDPAIRERDLGLQFVPGAIAGQFASTDGRTFTEPPADWKPAGSDHRASVFAGSPQSLAGDLLRQGASGVAAHVAEPFLDATVRPDILFAAYLSGFTLAEAFYLAIPSLSWQTVVVGDPLARVAPERPGAGAPETALDPATELPALFSARRLEAASVPGMTLEATKAMLRATARTAKGDTDGAGKALEEAIVLAPGVAAPRLALATMKEQGGDHERARALYREVIAADGKNIIALNNLAYSLAVHQKTPGDALPMAERAYTLSRGDPNVADTLGWVYHLLGNRAQAARYVGEAVRGVPASGEVRLHAAAILAAAGDVEGARRELAEALRLEPGLETSRAEIVAGVRALK